MVRRILAFMGGPRGSTKGELQLRGDPRSAGKGGAGVPREIAMIPELRSRAEPKPLPTTHESGVAACFQREMSLDEGRGQGSSEDDRDPRDAPPADPGPGPGLPRRQRRADPRGRRAPAAYAWMAETLRRFGYARLRRPERGFAVALPGKVSGLSRQQVTRLVAQWRASGRITDRRGPPAAPFARRYTRADIALLAEVDALHGTLSGPATRKLCERAYRLFGDARLNAWPVSPTATSTTCATAPPTNAARHGHQDRRCRSRSVNAAHPPLRPPRLPAGRLGPPRRPRRPQGVYLINTVDAITQFQLSAPSSASASASCCPCSNSCSPTFPSPSSASMPTTARSTSTIASPPCSTSCRSASSPSRGPPNQ